MTVIFDTRCSYANIVARKELHDAGLTSIEKLGTMKKPGGGKWVIAATAIGSGTYVYGNYVLEQYRGPDGAPLNTLVEWVGGGGSTTMLGGLKAGKFDAMTTALDGVKEQLRTLNGKVYDHAQEIARLGARE